MNKPRRNRRSDYYLDVADFILTDHRFRVPSPRKSPVQGYLNEIPTPNNLPVIIDVQGFELSPYFQQGKNTQIQFLDFTLEIPEDNQECGNSSIQSQSQFEQSDQNLQSISEEVSQKQEEYVDNEQDQPIPDLPSSKLNLKYFRQSLAQLRQKKSCQVELRDFIQEYIVAEENQLINFQNETIDNLITMAQHNLRQLGPISWLQRRSKVLKFKAKKSRRVWNKKINYDCRKKVADSRLRVKGKFVTKEQACNILGVQQANQDQLKELLCAKFHKNF